MFRPQGTAAIAVIVAEFGLLIAQIALARMRLLDLGQSPDDAFLVFVPFANLALFFQCLARTPSDALRARRLAIWQGEIGPLDAFTAAGGLWARALPILLPISALGALAYGGANAAAAWFLSWMHTAEAATVDSTMWALVAGSVICVVYALVQLWKAGTASRASWIPALFAIPFALLALALALRTSRDLGQATVSLPFEALNLLWDSIPAAILATITLSVGDRLSSGGTLGEAWEAAQKALRTRAADLVAVHGGAAHAVAIGLQVVIPGIHYLLVYSFTDMVVLFEPDKAAYKRSSDLTSGVRRRLFVAQLLGFLVYFFPSMFVSLASHSFDPSAFFQAFLDPSVIPWKEAALGGFIWMLAVALIKLTVLQMFRARVETSNRAPAPAIAAPPQDTKNPFASPTTEPAR